MNSVSRARAAISGECRAVRRQDAIAASPGRSRHEVERAGTSLPPTVPGSPVVDIPPGAALLALVSHELRSPLAAIQYSTRLLDDDRLKAADRERVRAMIERQLARVTSLLDDLTDTARVATGRLALRTERLDARIVVTRAVETLEGELAQRRHRLFPALPSLPVWVDGDAGRLEQVFINLLANASKYTDPGGELHVTLVARAGQAVVVVRDSGIGIEPASLPYIFDLFRQANAEDPRSHSGLGIGLALVRALVQRHGGSVTAASAGRGAGSEFTVCLPTRD